MDDLEPARALLGTYCELVDAGDWDAVGRLFARGRLADASGAVIAEGADAVTHFYRETVILHEGSPRTKHLVVNTVFDDPRDATVSSRSSFVVLQAAGDLPLQAIITGRYHDTFERDADAGWHFAERRFFIDLAGDMSRHLRTR